MLRLSPAGLKIAGPADVGRQGRIMSALSRARLPAPYVLAWDSSGAIDGRSFALMRLVDGISWSAFVNRHSHRAVAVAAVDALKRIQSLPPGQTGIADDHSAGPAYEVSRWKRLLDRPPGTLSQPAQALAERLLRDSDRVIEPHSPVLVHGDFHYGNLLFDHDGVVAVVDWEIATIGHPLTDLACLAVASLRRRYGEPNPTGDVDIRLADLVALHGTDVGDAPWHIATGCLKYAAILGYNLELHRRGKRHDPLYEELQGTMLRLVADAHTIIDSGVDGF